MKRDLELIRKIVIYFDEKPGPGFVQVPPIAGYDDASIKYHLVLLHDAGYLRCETIRSSTCDRVIDVIPFELTWNGHEFVDKVRNQYIWDEVMNGIRQRGFASASIDFVKKLLDAQLRKQLDIK